MLRSLIVISAILGAGASYAAAGDTCDATTFAQACDTGDATKLDVCADPAGGANTTVQVVDCTTLAAGAACGPASDCDGTGCAQLPTSTCIAQAGGECDGFGHQQAGTTGVVLCAGDDTCESTVNGQALADACVTHVGPACTAGGDAASCTGATLSICLEGTGVAIKSNLAVDCTVFGSQCAQQACTCDNQCNATCTTAADCNQGETCNGGFCSGSHCTGGFCDFGVTCASDPDPSQCAGGEGEGEGAGGEGEGTGAGCTQDSECGRDKVCDNGTCKDKSTTGATPPGCSDTGTGTAAPLAGLVAVVALGGFFRRRRA